LNTDQKAGLTRVLERLTGKRVEAQYSLDPALIGGAVVQIGSTIYDGSVREQLNRLRARLASE
jgi:F-type H+-transporting ATPase subunit delta